MPSLRMFCDVMAARTMNPTRKVRAQDLWDVDHARVGAAYAHVFATLDRELVDLLNNRCKISSWTKCEVVQGIASLTERLNSL